VCVCVCVCVCDKFVIGIHMQIQTYVLVNMRTTNPHTCTRVFTNTQRPDQAPKNPHIFLSFPLSAVRSFSMSPHPPTHPAISGLPSLHSYHHVHASEEHRAIAGCGCAGSRGAAPLSRFDILELATPSRFKDHIQRAAGSLGI
jgi:hypothetical protein